MRGTATTPCEEVASYIRYDHSYTHSLACGPLTSMTPSFDIPARVMAHAKARPWAPALKDDEVALSYSQLVDCAGQVARSLRSRGIMPGDRVVLLIPNSAAFPVAAIGCMLAGAVFVPLSPDDPSSRLQRLLDDCEPKVVVTAGQTQVAPLVGDLPGAKVARFEDLLEPGPALRRWHEDPDSDAYIIYTSGTSGDPKGARISRRAFGAAVAASARAQRLVNTTRSLCVSPFHFDGSYGTLFTTLAAGGCAVIPRRDQMLYLARFFTVVLDEAVTHVGMTPTYLRLLLASPRSARLRRSGLLSVGLGGEECLPDDVERIWRLCPGARVFNRYGPTETTIEVTTYEVRGQDVLAGRVPLGSPHRGVAFHIVSDNGSTVTAPGASGELYIGGAQLMSGYWRDPELTASVLRDDVVPGEVLYKSGDIVSRDEDGRYFFAGRADDVVKRQGVRISLTELDRALSRVLRGRRVVCLAVKSGMTTRIKAFVEGAMPDTAALYAEAASELPSAMLPDEVVALPALPLGSSGKLDRRRLLQEGEGVSLLAVPPDL